MNERDEMRRLIDVIERGADAAGVTQNVEDLKLFANAASAIANKLDAKVKAANRKRQKKAAKQLPIPKPTKPPVQPTFNSVAVPSTAAQSNPSVHAKAGGAGPSLM